MVISYIIETFNFRPTDRGQCIRYSMYIPRFIHRWVVDSSDDNNDISLGTMNHCVQSQRTLPPSKTTVIVYLWDPLI